MLQCYHHHGISNENRAEISGRYDFFFSKICNTLIFSLYVAWIIWSTFYNPCGIHYFILFPEALESLKEINESVCPNDGFLDQVSFHYELVALYLTIFLLLSRISYTLQLKLFEEMGFKVDTSSPLYRRFRLKLLGWSFSNIYFEKWRQRDLSFCQVPHLISYACLCGPSNSCGCRVLLLLKIKQFCHRFCKKWSYQAEWYFSILAAHWLNVCLLLVAGQSYKVGEKIGNHVFEDDPGVARQPNPTQELSGKEETLKTAYRCKKCRRIVAEQNNVIGHTPGEGNSSFEWHDKRKKGHTYNKEQDCSSLYVEPLKWMTPGKFISCSNLLRSHIYWCGSWHITSLFIICCCSWWSSRRWCFGGEAVVHPLRGTPRVLQLVRDSVQLWQLDHPCLPNFQEQSWCKHHLDLLHGLADSRSLSGGGVNTISSEPSCIGSQGAKAGTCFMHSPIVLWNTIPHNSLQEKFNTS